MGAGDDGISDETSASGDVPLGMVWWWLMIGLRTGERVFGEN